MPSSPTEFEIQRALCIWLDGYPGRPAALIPGAVYFHVPNGGGRSAVEGARFKQSGVKAGIPDLLFLHQGRLFGLELKTATGTTSDAQRAMHARLLAAGAAGIAVANSLDAAKAQLVSWGLAFETC